MDEGIVVDPVPRVFGDCRLKIFLDRSGDVKNAYLQAKQLRGFEEICRGRPIEELPMITSRICGRCGWQHYLASCKAVDQILGIKPSSGREDLRRLINNIAHFSDGLLMLYYLSMPDLINSGNKGLWDAIGQIGKETYSDASEMRSRAQRMLATLQGEQTHLASAQKAKGLGGDLEKDLRSFLSFSEFTFDLFEEVMLKNQGYNRLRPEGYEHLETYYQGLVDEKGKVDLYSGKIMVVGPGGEKKHQYNPENYLRYIAEHVEPWTYSTFPYLKQLGWKGFVDGPDSGVYRTGPLARFNASRGFKTERAQDAYERILEITQRPCHDNYIAYIARLAEVIYACEEAVEIASNGLGSNEAVAGKERDSGIGFVEAPDGLLIHHYAADRKKKAKNVNVISGTNQNNAAICMSVRRAARLLKQKDPTHPVEKAVREYLPCMRCSSH